MYKIITLLSILFLSSCILYNENVVDIPESSWICYMDTNDTFYVVNDEWGVYNIDSKWEILNSIQLWEYDFEWIYCNNDNKELYLLQENKPELLVVDRESFKVTSKIKIKTLSKKKYFNNKSWAEGLTFNKGYFYISFQSTENNLMRWKLNNNNEELIISDTYTIDKEDLSWLDFYNNKLYIISDKKEQIYIYDISAESIIETINLNKKHWEWIAFDKDWVKYLADDEWSIIRYTK